MEIIYTFVAIVVGLLIGILLGLALSKRTSIPASRFHESETKLAVLQNNFEIAEQKNAMYETLKSERDELSRKLAAMGIEHRHLTDQFSSVQSAHQTMAKELEEKNKNELALSKQISTLEEANSSLQERITNLKQEIDNARETFKTAFTIEASKLLEEKTTKLKTTNKEELDSILNPLKIEIKDFGKKIEDTRKEDIQDLTTLKTEIRSLQALGIQLSTDAHNLATALKSDIKVQGNWGEDRLRLILESEGLQKYIDFKMQEGYRDNELEINRRPDLILNLPNEKHIIIDSKVSLTAYVNYANASLPEERSAFLKQHVKSVTEHIDLLSDKNYHALQGLNTPDYVFMFMPIESAITLAINESPDLFNRALNKKIVIITPTTLVATLKVVKMIWQKENQVKNVEDIFKQCGLLYDKFVSFIENMDDIGNNLEDAQRSYKEAMDRLTHGARKGDTIVGRFEKIRKLEAKTKKHIPAKYVNEISVLDDEGEITDDEVENEAQDAT